MTQNKSKKDANASPTSNVNNTVKKGDFIEIIYTGYIKETGKVFDTTDKSIAEREGIKGEVCPAVICVGKRDILEGIDASLEGRRIGEEYSLDLKEGFGKRNANLIALVPSSDFTEQKIDPYPGLEIAIDGRMGIVRRVGSGRVLVDFNHPLAGKDIKYKIRIERFATHTKEKADAFLKMALGIKKADTSLAEAEGIYEIRLSLPEEIREQLTKELKERIQELKEVKFSEGKEEWKEEEAKENKNENEARPANETNK